MKITSELTAEEYVRSIRLTRLKRGPLGRLYAFQSYFYQALGALLLALVSYRAYEGAIDGALFAVGGFGIWCLVALPLTRWVSKRDFWKDSRLHGPKTYVIDEHGFSLQGHSDDRPAVWKQFSGYSEDESLFVIFHRGRMGFTPITKSKMTADEVGQFRTELGKYLPRR